jgi:hypothetical protein
VENEKKKNGKIKIKKLLSVLGGKRKKEKNSNYKMLRWKMKIKKNVKRNYKMFKGKKKRRKYIRK